MAGFGLRRQATRARLVCLVTREISNHARAALLTFYDEIITVNEVNLPREERGVRQMFPRMFTRFAALRLGPDGDLGCAFRKLILMDADLLPLRGFDSLWRLDPPAGIINERREHIVELDERGRIVPRSDSTHPRSVWHSLYVPICPHGTRIPREITDRVETDPSNRGVNGSLFVFEPSSHTHDEFMSWLSTPSIDALVRSQWPWPDQQAATLFWSGRWTSIDVSYSTLYGYPSVAAARGLHFAGVKPWSWRKRGFEYRLKRFSDYRLWASMYLQMLDSFQGLRSLRRLSLLEHRIFSVLGGSRQHIVDNKTANT